MRPIGVLLFTSFFFVFSFSVWAGYSLVVEGLPTEIGSTQSFSYTASFSGETYHYFNKTYFLRGVFCSPDSTSYFGFTLNNLGNWVSTSGDKSQFFSITTSPEGTWSGQLQAVVDNGGGMDGFSSGEYFFKLGRYTSPNSSADWNEPIALVINFPSPTPTSTPTSTSTPEPSSTSIPTSTATEKVIASSEISLTASPSSFVSHLQSIFLGSSSVTSTSGSVLATSSSKVKTLFPPLLVFGSGLFLFSASLFLAKPEFPWGKE